MRKALCLLLVVGLAATPALAQQPIQDSAKRQAAGAVRDNAGQGTEGSSRARLVSGAVLGLAGGAAIILGTTALRTSKTESGNTPRGAYDSCIALKTNPVYRANDCDGLKGPNTPVVIGGLAAAAAGVTLMILGSSASSVEFGAGGVALRHRVKF